MPLAVLGHVSRFGAKKNARSGRGGKETWVGLEKGKEGRTSRRLGGDTRFRQCDPNVLKIKAALIPQVFLATANAPPFPACGSARLRTARLAGIGRIPPRRRKELAEHERGE
ncbi:hypothetical protein KM043_003042 [Ampulex compressa]|nr:hypothetical protein KM043_003042 [Ampulex compressa]